MTPAFKKQFVHSSLKQASLYLDVSYNEQKMRSLSLSSPGALEVLCLTFTRLCCFFFGEAKKAWSKTLITPCAPGEFDFSAPSREECSALGSEDFAAPGRKKSAGQHATRPLHC